MKLAYAIMIPWIILSILVGCTYGSIYGAGLYFFGGLLWAYIHIKFMMAFDGRKK